MFETNWRAGMQDVSAAIDRVMGEQVAIIPVVCKPNFQPVADESKRVLATAVFTYKADTVFESRRPRRHDAGHSSLNPILEVESHKPVFSFDAKSLPIELHRSFVIERFCDGSRFEITDIKPDGVTRVVVHVVQLGKPAADV